MTRFVVAIEFDGPDLPAQIGGPRTPIREHAYDIDRSVLAHHDRGTRVGFPEPQRGWSTVPTTLTCGGCRDAVTELVRARIRQLTVAAAEAAKRGETADCGPRWVWLYPPALP